MTGSGSQNKDLRYNTKITKDYKLKKEVGIDRCNKKQGNKSYKCKIYKI